LALLAALLFGLMLFQARRFIEYFPPFALIFAAFAGAPLFQDPQPASASQARSGLWATERGNLPSTLLAVAMVLPNKIPACEKYIEMIRL
jgi:hypothetical protein